MRRLALWLFSGGVAVLGTALIAGGAVLVRLDGSWYYLTSGCTLVACAVLLHRSRATACRMYGILILGTIVWALWEVGNDAWALAPRLILIATLGLGFAPRGNWRWLKAGSALLAVAVALGLVGHVTTHQRLSDPLFRTGYTQSEWVDPPRGSAAAGDWMHVGNDMGGRRFSSLTQIAPGNVSRLKPAWTYRTGDVGVSLEVTPLKVGRMVYLCTGLNDVIALDAETGVERWRFRAGISGENAVIRACRGVAYFHVPEAGSECPDRILSNTIDARLIALDAATGIPCSGFGKGGQVSLLNGMGDWRGRKVPGYYYVTSAPTVIRGNVIVGGWVADGQYWGEPSGVVRAFDAVTGRFVWAFDMGRPDRNTEPPEGEQYTPSTPNAWAPMSADEELGLVYVPTGNTSGSDYYGGLRRPFDERYSSSVVALDASNGSVRWSFQTVHHDLWDYDVAPQPVLTDISGPHGPLHALIQATKTGEIFVLDRADGVPLFPVEEVPAPAASEIPGERMAQTQPASIAMPSFRGPALEERDMWGLTPVDQMLCRIAFRRARYQGIYTPPGVTEFIEYPGILGGIEWSSVSADPVRNLLVVNSSRMANRVRLIPRAQADIEGRKPEGFGGHYLQRTQAGTPYAVSNPFFLSSLGLPCQNPPYGLISAVDLRSGKLVWSKWLGTARASGPFGIPSHLPFPLGTPGLGGTLVTQSGLTFVAAGQDRFLRAFRTSDGQLLWQQQMPSASISTPMTYRSDASGRQFIVAAAGNDDPRLGEMGDAVVAYALSQDSGVSQ